ncbi:MULTISPECIES: protein kinase family protein [unclassified Nocardioides]|uniref:protein kinase family protein n=1 Tax=unclassified Nocardioides TaxID=2615069 RepID=UPI003014FC68
MPHSNRPGDVLAGRYRLVDLLSESGNGRFWRAHDRVLERHVALHVIAEDDDRAAGLVEAARRSATVLDPRILRVLDAERTGGLCYVVNEWGSGTSLDIVVATHGALPPRRAAWLVAEVADSVAVAHAAGVAHGRLAPENVLIDQTGAVKVIGFSVDAALHGLAPGRTATDVTDLAGLLYCALTGKWAGVSTSAVPPAPQEHGRVLRPRQVRAGVPRPLDALCDEVLNPYSGGRQRDDVDLETARGIADLLADFVGDPTGLPEQLALSNLRPGETVVLPQVPEIPVREADPEPEPEPTPEPTPVPEPEPTQAGLPIFDDEHDDVSWLEAPETPSPPPPPFESPPERPLFAPEPADGGPARQVRPTVTAREAQDRAEYWPWGGDGPPTSGTGITPAVEDVPGRSWLRLAFGIGAALLLLVAVVIAFNLGRGKTPLGAEPDDDPTTTPSASATPSATPRPISGLRATDLDPAGNPPRENPDTVGRVVDGDPETTWRTSTYNEQFGPGGLKDGVGVVVDLGRSYDVAQVDLRLVGRPTVVSLYLTDEAPSDVEGLTPFLADQRVGTEASLAPDAPVAGRYLTVWLTALPSVEDGFRGEVAEIAVRG